MLKLIIGEIGSGKSTCVFEDIKHSIENRERCYLIVPEQKTLDYERTMADILPGESPLYFEVTNFSHLANTIFRALGGLSYNYADSSVKTLIMWRTLSELSPLLNEKIDFFDRNKINNCLSMISKLHFLRISASQLSKAADIVTDSHLKKRLNDMSLIYTMYKSLLESEYSDVEEDLDRACELLSENNFFQGKKIYIDAFTDFTEQQYLLISRVMGTTDVTITVPYDFSGEKQCFAESTLLLSRLHDMADKLKVETKHKNLYGNKRTKSPLIAFVADNIWSHKYNSARYEGEPDSSLTVAEANDIYDECDFVAANIRQKVAKGAAYSDFAVVCADTAMYSGIIDESFRRYAIPFFMSRRTDIDSLEIVKFIHSAYAVINRGFLREDVITYMKCGLSDIKDEMADMFELYAERWDINGRKMFLSEDDWNMNPRGYVGSYGESDFKVLDTVNCVRRRITDSLMNLMSEGHLSVREHTELLINFLVKENVESKMAQRAKSFALKSDNENAEYYARIWGTICDCLDKTVATIGDIQVGSDRYDEILKLVFGEIDLGRIPPTVDTVTVADADTARVEGKPHIFIIGANDGVFPAPVRDEGLFGKEEISQLTDAGIFIEDDFDIRRERKLFVFLRAMLSPSATLTISYYLQTAQMAYSVASIAVKRIRDISNGAENFIKTDSLSFESRIYTRDSAYHTMINLPKGEERNFLEKALSNVDELSGIVPNNIEISADDCRIKPDTAQKIFGDRLYLTQSRIEKFVKCPFSFYCKYVLKLSDNQKSDFDAVSIGNFMHAVFERFFTLLHKRRQKISEISRCNLDEITEELCREYIDEICPKEKRGSARLQVLFGRLKRSALLILSKMQDEFLNSSFNPSFFEMSIANNGNIRPLEFSLPGKGKISVYGIADRVDTYEKNGKTYIRIIDYKTGGKKFLLSDVEKGLNLQMLLYLFSVSKNGGKMISGELVPAGVFYMSSKTSPVMCQSPSVSYAEAEEMMKKDMKNSGIMLDDEDLKEAMDNTGGKYFPVKDEKCLVSLSEMGMLFDKLKDTVCKIGEDILSGQASVPGKAKLKEMDSCKYCEMKSVCRMRIEN